MKADVLVPAAHMGDLHGVLGSQLRPGPTLAVVGIWGENQQTEELTLSVALHMLPFVPGILSPLTFTGQTLFTCKLRLLECLHLPAASAGT